MREPEDILREAQELEDFWKRVSEAGIPKTVEEAESTGWDILAEVSQLGIPLPIGLGYDPEQRRLDRQRMIRTPTALLILEGYEERLIDVTTTGPRQIFMNKIRRWGNILSLVKTAISLIWTLVINTIDGYDILDLAIWLVTFGILGDTDAIKKSLLIGEHIFQLVRRYCSLLLSYGLLTVSVPTFSAHLNAVVEARDEHVGYVRKNALPQRDVKRHWRRKVSRL